MVNKLKFNVFYILFTKNCKKNALRRNSKSRLSFLIFPTVWGQKLPKNEPNKSFILQTKAI